MNNSNPLITVLMPCYNAMPYLPEAIESMINQTYKNLEILCINDGSTDETGAVLEQYAKQDSRVRVVHNETNLRLIRSLNKGIELAQGEYIARMDADDISALNRIEVELKYMQAHPEIDILSTGSYNMTEDGVVFSQNIPRAHNLLSCYFASFFFVPVGHPELLIKTSVLKDNHFLFEDYVLHTEDYELWSRLLSKGYNLCNIDLPLHFFRINSQSVSRKFTDIQDENFIECAKQHFYKYTNISLSNDVVSVFVNRMNVNTKLHDFREGLKQMRKLKKIFLLKEKIIDSNEIKEIEDVYYSHLFDLCYQYFKRKSGISKLFGLWYLLFNFKMIFNKSVFAYILTKRKSYSIKVKKPTYQQCTRCVMDTSDVDIHFDENGVCNHCTNYFERIASRVYQGEQSDAELLGLIEDIKKAGKGKKYDCVIGVSGGVDSSYVVYKAQKRGLRALLVHLDNGWNSEVSVKNIKNLAHIAGFDYESYVLDWEEFRDIQLSFLRASIPEMETPTDIAIPGALHKVAAKYGVKYIISGGNFATEGILPKTWHYNAKDMTYFSHIIKTFGRKKMRKFPRFGWKEELYYKLFKGIKITYILNYVPYNKAEAMGVLEDELGWKYYGGKHYESKYTGFVQSYIMPEKFNMDYRRATLSTQICTGEVTREDALQELQNLPYNAITAKTEKEYVCKKLGISIAEFDKIMSEPAKTYRDYPNAEARLEFLYNIYRKWYKKPSYKGE